MLVRLFDTHFHELFVSHPTTIRNTGCSTTAGTTCRLATNENQNKEYC
ncbi:MAG: hypothetical protein V3T45_04200 [Nitrospinaceae bacterium]